MTTPKTRSSELRLHRARPSQPLWRYMKLSTLLGILADRQVFIPSLGCLQSSDPNEGYLLRRSRIFDRVLWSKLDEVREWLLERATPQEREILNPASAYAGAKHLSQGFRHEQKIRLVSYDVLLRELSMRRFIWCWYAGDSESMAQWRLYAEQGVAIHSTVVNIGEALAQAALGPLCCMGVRYVESENPNSARLKGLNPFWPFALKQACYSHESEVRFVIARDQPRSRGIYLKLNSLEFIKRVTVSPFLPAGESLAVCKALKRFLPTSTAVDPSSERWQKEPWQIAESVEQEKENEQVLLNSVEGASDLPEALRDFGPARSGRNRVDRRGC